MILCDIHVVTLFEIWQVYLYTILKKKTYITLNKFCQITYKNLYLKKTIKTYIMLYMCCETCISYYTNF